MLRRALLCTLFGWISGCDAIDPILVQDLAWVWFVVPIVFALLIVGAERRWAWLRAGQNFDYEDGPGDTEEVDSEHLSDRNRPWGSPCTTSSAIRCRHRRNSRGRTWSPGLSDRRLARLAASSAARGGPRGGTRGFTLASNRQTPERKQARRQGAGSS